MSPRTPLRRLSPAQRQLVAIARALSMNARLLVLDEPTSSLGAVEAERLFAVLQDLRAGGAGIVYISHRLQEIERLADRAVVLRDGRHAGSLSRNEISHDRLVQLMVGRAVDRLRHAGMRRPSADSQRATSGLQIDGIRTARYPGAEVSLTIRPWRGARHRGAGRRGTIGAGRNDLRHRPAPRRRRRARRPDACHHFATRRHPAGHLSGAGGSAATRRNRCD